MKGITLKGKTQKLLLHRCPSCPNGAKACIYENSDKKEQGRAVDLRDRTR